MRVDEKGQERPKHEGQTDAHWEGDGQTGELDADDEEHVGHVEEGARADGREDLERASSWLLRGTIHLAVVEYQPADRQEGERSDREESNAEIEVVHRKWDVRARLGRIGPRAPAGQRDEREDKAAGKGGGLPVPMEPIKHHLSARVSRCLPTTRRDPSFAKFGRTG